MMRDFLVLLAVGFFAIFGLLYLVFWLDETSCAQVGEETSHEVKYVLPTGCFVKTSDGWVPLERWRSVAE